MSLCGKSKSSVHFRRMDLNFMIHAVLEDRRGFQEGVSWHFFSLLSQAAGGICEKREPGSRNPILGLSSMTVTLCFRPATGWEMIRLLMQLNPPPSICPVLARGREARKCNPSIASRPIWVDQKAFF